MVDLIIKYMASTLVIVFGIGICSRHASTASMFLKGSKKRIAIVRPTSPEGADSLLSSFELWDIFSPCDPKENPYAIDLYISFSRETDSSRQSIQSFQDAMSKTNGWGHCIDHLFILNAEILQDQDVYDESIQLHDRMWVNGPNAQFRSLFRDIREKNLYECFLIMESDTFPLTANWLDRLVQEVQDNKPFAILGSKYKGHAWDAFVDQMPLALVNHLNGNAFYNVSNTLLNMIVDELEEEKDSYYGAVSYDYRISQIVTESSKGVASTFPFPEMLANNTAVLSSILPDKLDKFQMWWDEYGDPNFLKESNIIANYGAVKDVVEDIGDFSVVHGRQYHPLKQNANPLSDPVAHVSRRQLQCAGYASNCVPEENREKPGEELSSTSPVATTMSPTGAKSVAPTVAPTKSPQPTISPQPTAVPSASPTAAPTKSSQPTAVPSAAPTAAPTKSSQPTPVPSVAPTTAPVAPTVAPTGRPTESFRPSVAPPVVPASTIPPGGRRFLGELSTSDPALAKFSNYKDTENVLDRTSDVPVFWHVPKSGGSTVKRVLGGCYHFVMAAQAMPDTKQDKLMVRYNPKGSVRFVSVDVTTPVGIERAQALGFAGSGLADTVVTPYVLYANALFNSKVRGRLFTVLRHPIDRAMSLFRYLPIATWEPSYAPELKNWTLEQYSSSRYAENNWLTRYLSGNLVDELSTQDLETAKEVLERKVIIGLMEEMPKSMERFEKFFQWKYRVQPSSQERCRQNYVTKGANVNRRKKQKFLPGDKEWELLAKHNEYDIDLYNYAVQLFEEQERLFVDIPDGARHVNATCCKCDPPTFPPEGYECPNPPNQSA